MVQSHVLLQRLKVHPYPLRLRNAKPTFENWMAMTKVYQNLGRKWLDN